MRVLLIDVDSKIPNLALMKISAYHKSKGDIVGFGVSDPNKIYVSIIFDKHKRWADGLKFYYPDSIIDIGGSGYDLNKKLPEEIDNCTPDYNLYPNCDRFYSFTSRGCIRNCPFCIVPKKEGKFRTLYDDPKIAIENITGNDVNRYDKIEFLDNNILADKNWFLKLCDYLVKLPYSVDFNQGLDIRLIDSETATALSKLKTINCWKFAFDNISYEDSVIKGIKTLNDNGVDVRHTVIFYVYCNDDNCFNDALKRCETLKKLGATPYLMINQHSKKTKRMTDLKRWCRPWVFWTVDFNDYKRGVKI